MDHKVHCPKCDSTNIKLDTKRVLPVYECKDCGNYFAPSTD